MEQDRTPALLPDHSQLARPTPHHLPNHHQPHRQHHNHHRTHRPLRTRPQPLPHKNQSHHSGTKIHTPDPTQVPAKLELHHPNTSRNGRRPHTAHPAHDRIGKSYYITAPNSRMVDQPATLTR